MSAGARRRVPLLARMTEQGKQTWGRGARARILAVTSGKGGVGKTSLAVQIACELSRRGQRTILVDAGSTYADAPTYAGETPQPTLWHYVSGAAALADVSSPGPRGLRVVRCSSGPRQPAGGDDEGRRQLRAAVEQLRATCDVIVLDTAAGVGRDVTDFVTMADEIVLVTTSNFAAVADAYGVVKVLKQDGFDKPVHAVVNRARSAAEAAQVFAKLRGCTERFLGFDLNWLGLLPEDSSVGGAVSQRPPFSEAFPGSVATRHLAKMVSDLEQHVEAPGQARTAAGS